MLAFGGDLSIDRLLVAYSKGIFPWYQEGQPILWWTPAQRTVITPQTIHVSRSMARFINKTNWTIRIDSHFDDVVKACGKPRKKQSGTWITPAMRHAYGELHNAGFAHSIEVYDNNTLVGGLYGIALGRIFFGESMFSFSTNASKTAIIVLSRFLAKQQFVLIDCQVASDHVFSLGASQISRLEFEQALAQYANVECIRHKQRIWAHASNQVVSVDGHIQN